MIQAPLLLDPGTTTTVDIAPREWISQGAGILQRHINQGVFVRAVRENGRPAAPLLLDILQQGGDMAEALKNLMVGRVEAGPAKLCLSGCF